MARILIADDDTHLTSILKDILERHGHEAVEAADGVSALSLCAQQKFDLVITDILMPEKEGIEVISELSKAFPDTKIIAMSGGGRVDATHYLDMAKEFGADRVIIKPFDHQQIIDTVDVLLWPQRMGA
ncbi:response regulator [Planctomycetota bacterium]